MVKYFKFFGSDCYILQDQENLEKLMQKAINLDILRQAEHTGCKILEPKL